jgi:hypothetical protein
MYEPPDDRAKAMDAHMRCLEADAKSVERR